MQKCECHARDIARGMFVRRVLDPVLFSLRFYEFVLEVQISLGFVSTRVLPRCVLHTFPTFIANPSAGRALCTRCRKCCVFLLWGLGRGLPRLVSACFFCRPALPKLRVARICCRTPKWKLQSARIFEKRLPKKVLENYCRPQTIT